MKEWSPRQECCTSDFCEGWYQQYHQEFGCQYESGLEKEENDVHFKGRPWT